jgi:SAM-dependent methyltransferase
MKEAEIRPAALFERYLDLSRQDIDEYFSDHSRFQVIDCPACGEAGRTPAFVKFGFEYQTCNGCSSLYLSPRPSIEMQSDYARNSRAVEFWSTHFYKETAEARREKMFRPRAEQVSELVERRIVEPGVLADVGAGYGIFLEELERRGTFEKLVAIEPAPGLAQICRDKGYDVVPKFVEDVTDDEILADLATAFEVVEHVYDPADFLRACRRALKPGGFLQLTTLTITGFDLQVLWSASNSIYPPHHINLLSVDGLAKLVGRCGFEVVELTTPGRLDVDIVVNALKADPSIDAPRFARTLAACDQAVRDDFQQFLQRAKLSSHVRVLARRTD